MWGWFDFEFVKKKKWEETQKIFVDEEEINEGKPSLE